MTLEIKRRDLLQMLAFGTAGATLLAGTSSPGRKEPIP